MSLEVWGREASLVVALTEPVPHLTFPGRFPSDHRHSSVIECVSAESWRYFENMLAMSIEDFPAGQFHPLSPPHQRVWCPCPRATRGFNNPHGPVLESPILPAKQIGYPLSSLVLDTSVFPGAGEHSRTPTPKSKALYAGYVRSASPACAIPSPLAVRRLFITRPTLSFSIASAWRRLQSSAGCSTLRWSSRERRGIAVEPC